MPVLNDAEVIWAGATLASKVYAGTTKVYPPDYFDAVTGGLLMYLRVDEAAIVNGTAATAVVGRNGVYLGVQPPVPVAGLLTSSANGAVFFDGVSRPASEARIYVEMPPGPTVPPTSESLHTDTIPNGTGDGYYTLGHRVRITQPGQVTHLRYFHAVSLHTTGNHVLSLWDDVGNKLATVTDSGPNAQERMLGASAPPGSNSGNFTVGVRFNVLTAGVITHIRYWHVACASVTHYEALYRWNGSAFVRVASASSAPTTTGFHEVALATPVVVAAGETYLAAHSWDGTNAGEGPAATSLSPNLTWSYALYADGSDVLPTNVSASNYFVDVVYSPDGYRSVALGTPYAITAPGIYRVSYTSLNHYYYYFSRFPAPTTSLVHLTGCNSAVSVPEVFPGPLSGGMYYADLVFKPTDSGLTLSFVLRRDSDSFPQTYMAFFSWGYQATSPGYSFLYYGWSTIFYQFTDGTIRVLEVPNGGFPLMKAGKTYHLVFTHDFASGVWRVVIDGVQVATGNLVTAGYGMPLPIPASASLYLGTYSGTAYLWNGVIDEPRIYGRALSLAEAQKLYVAGTGGTYGPQERMLASDAPLSPNSGDLTVGARFDVLAAGVITHIRYWHVACASVTHYESLWRWSGSAFVRVASATSLPPAGYTGWWEVPLVAPVTVTVNETYMAAHSWNDTDAMNGTTPAVSIAPSLTATGAFYSFGSDVLPTTAFGANLFVDVVYRTGSLT